MRDFTIRMSVQNQRKKTQAICPIKRLVIVEYQGKRAENNINKAVDQRPRDQVFSLAPTHKVHKNHALLGRPPIQMRGNGGQQ